MEIPRLRTERKIPGPLQTDERVFEQLAELMKKYEARYRALKIATFNPDNPLHRLETTYLAAQSADIDTNEALIEEFNKGTTDIVMPAFEESKGLLDDVVAAINSGENIVLATAHESLADIIFVAYGLQSALVRSGRIDHKEIVDLTHIVVSRTIACLETNLGGEQEIPAPELLRLLGHLYFSLPNSPRIRKDAAIDQSIVRINNRSLKNDTDSVFTRRLKDGKGRILCVAAPGTTDEVVANGTEELAIIKKVVPATTKYLINPADHFLRVDAAFEIGRPGCKVNALQRIGEQGVDMDAQMRESAKNRTYITGIPTVYDPTK